MCRTVICKILLELTKLQNSGNCNNKSGTPAVDTSVYVCVCLRVHACVSLVSGLLVMLKVTSYIPQYPVI